MSSNKTMTVLEEEDELFGAHLSLDFDEDARKNRPWQSARRRDDGNERTRDVYREPYELLDDVPPAKFSSQTSVMKSRYPVDEYYPRIDGIGSDSARRRVTFRLENDSSPYSIDDYSEVDAISSNSRGSRMSYSYAENDNIYITESRSDSEMSIYESMNDNYYSPRDENEYYSDEEYESSADYTSPGRNELSTYEYDNNSYDSHDTDIDSASGGDRSRSSMSTFDRFYHEGIADSPGTHLSERSDRVSASENAEEGSLGAVISETLQNDSFNFAGTLDEGVEGTDTGIENKIDDSAHTPLRSNARNETRKRTSSSRRGESDDIFRIHGADSFLSSKSGGLSADASSSDVSSPNSSHQSEDSAIQHLADFDKSRESSPSNILDVEPHPTARMIAGSRKTADPPEERNGANECGRQRTSAQEPDGYKQFGLFPDILRSELPGNIEVLGNETEDSQQDDDFSSDQIEENDSEENDFNGQEPDGECYNDIKHKLVQFEDVYEEDEVGKVCEEENRDFDFATDISFSSSKSSCHGNKELIVDDASVISEDTDIRCLAKQHILRSKDKQADRMNTYAVKDKDSMESGIKINSEGENQPQPCSAGVYVIKENESMESFMNIDSLERKTMDDNHAGMKATCSVISPPLIKRKQFNFMDMDDMAEESLVDCSESSTSTHHYSFDDASDASADDESDASADSVSEDKSFDDESKTSDDPSIFPSKAIFQMNLNQHQARAGVSDISGDLIEKACGQLSRGRNGDALDTLTIALNRAENSMNHAKAMRDDHYSSKTCCSRVGMNAGMSEKAFEEQLETNFQCAASEMADIMNNIGVVHEMNGDVQKAMNSFREALTVYRNMCHRYENTDDSDVDRTVSNIMQMGIAMRSQRRRLELHSKARNLEKQILTCDDPSTRQKLNVERLNTLMCVIEVESESLGRTHPSVGFTLMKKGKLHLHLNHIDEAIKDHREAIDILKRGLGHIHPEVGRAMMRLADIFNYHSNGDWELDKHTARTLYQEALTPLRETFGNVNADLASAHNSIGIIFAMKNDTVNAMKSFYDALVGYGVRTRADEETSIREAICPDVFFVWINVGDLHSKRNEWQLALRSYQKACTSFRSLSDSERNYLRDVGSRRIIGLSKTNSRMSFDNNEALLSSILQKIGKAQCLMHKYGKSVETLQEALRIQEVLLMRCGGIDANHAREVARLLGNLGEVQMLSGNLTSSLESYLQALHILRSNGCNDESIEVALVLGAIGQLHLKKGCYVEAIVTLQHCMRIFDSNGVPVDNNRIKGIRSFLVDAELALIQNKTSINDRGQDISNFQQYDDRAVAVDEIADMYKNKGDYSGAIWFYTEALEMRRKSEQTKSVNIGRTICNIAHMRSLRGEFEAASILFDEVKHIYHSAQLRTDHPFYKDYLSLLSDMRKM